MKRTLLKTAPKAIIVSLLLLAPVLSGCHTIQGVGKDITAVGDGLESATH